LFSPTRLASRSISPETSGSGWSIRLDDACFGDRGSATIRCEGHDLDAEARINGLDLVAEEPSHALHVAQRQGCADPRTTVDAVANQI
jgi:hypothetical protein